MSNKLIDRLEELADEMKVIVHQLRMPTTIQAVEDVIEFEGKQYKKVDREAREGDVVVFRNARNYVTSDEPYPIKMEDRRPKVKDNDGDLMSVYAGLLEDYTESVDVYKLIAEDKSKIQGISIEIDAPKSANQLRAEVIEKAKIFVDENGGDDYHFEIDEEKRFVLAWTIDREANEYKAKAEVATCHPNDVFNEHIGKAIALGRVLGLDVSEFENAVQPNGKVVGQIIQIEDGRKATIIGNGTLAHIDNGTVQNGSTYAITGTIINDTNAEYEVV